MAHQTDCLNCPLREQHAFASNSAEELAFIQQFKHNELKVAAGKSILRENEHCKELFTLLSGWAFRYRSLSDGRRQILSCLLPGDFIGLQQEVSSGAPHGVEALTACTLCTFPRDKLWALYRQHPGLGYDLTWISANQELIVDENLVSVGRRTALERVAMLLVHLYKRAQAVGLEDAEGISLPITQQHLADALGLSLVHTNKTLRRLHELEL